MVARSYRFGRANHAQKFRVWISGQVRRLTSPIRREMRRRAAVEPVIGHMKAKHRMGRNHLNGRDGDWLERFLPALSATLLAALQTA